MICLPVIPTEDPSKRQRAGHLQALDWLLSVTIQQWYYSCMRLREVELKEMADRASSQLEKILYGCVVCLIFFPVGLASIANAQESKLSASTTPTSRQVLKKGLEPVEIVGTIVAMSQEAVIESLDGSANILIVRVEKVLKGKVQGHYVRADFADQTAAPDPGRTQEKRREEYSLHEGKVWKIHLRPPSGTAECAWAIPSPPPPGEESGFEVPPMIPVGGAKEFPNINTLPCYAFGQKDIQEVIPPQKR